MFQKNKILDDEIKVFKKRLMIFAACGFFVGIIAANTFCKSTITELGMFGDYFFMQLKRVEIDKSALFWQVFEKRMLFVFGVLIISGITLARQVNYLLAAWIGNSLGMFLAASILQQGMAGIILCIAGLFPHYMIYIPTGILLMINSVRFSDKLYEKNNYKFVNFRKEFIRYLTGSLLVISVFFLGIILESTISSIFLQKIYKIFNNIL